MKEIDITHMATFWTIPRGNGVLHGEGQGVITTKDGSGEMATEIGRGIGKITDGGKKSTVSWFLFFQSIFNREVGFPQQYRWYL
jgi:hypothetical protein